MASILVLGGAGDMGSGIVKFLAEDERVDRVVIGDISRARASRVLEELGEFKSKAEYVEIDASATSKLIEIMSKYDVVVNAIGPFYYWAGRIASAAVKAEVHLVDICDDYEGAKDVLSLRKEAASQGVTLITGLGWTPGITNVLARYAFQLLDEVKAIDISWVGSAADSKGFAVIVHVFYAVTGKVPMYIGGEEKLVEAGTGTLQVEFPPPIGKVKVFYTGHPEPVTIPQYLSVKDRVTLRGALVPEYQNSLVKFFVKLGLTKTHSRRVKLAKIIHRVESIFRAGGKPVSSARVDIIGERGGEETVLSFSVIDRMYRLTALPAAIGAIWLVTGRIKEYGAYPPEGIIEPRNFIMELQGKGIQVLEYRDGWRNLEFS